MNLVETAFRGLPTGNTTITENTPSIERVDLGATESVTLKDARAGIKHILVQVANNAQKATTQS